MENKKNTALITNVDIRIGLSMILSLLIASVVPGDLIQKLAACTAAIMCTQETAKFSWQSELKRMLGVIIGGVCAVLVVALDEWIGNDYVFILLCGLGIELNLISCKLVKMPPVLARVSCITFALVTLVMPGMGRVNYALLRLLGTAVGATVALLISWIYDKCFGRKNHTETFERT